MMKITERKPDPMVKKYHYNSIIDTERKPDPMVKKYQDHNIYPLLF
jgi:hypothetical protein